MAYSAFGEQFGESLRQAWKSADERDEKEKDRKARIQDLIDVEERRAKRLLKTQADTIIESLYSRPQTQGSPLSKAYADVTGKEDSEYYVDPNIAVPADQYHLQLGKGEEDPLSMQKTIMEKLRAAAPSEERPDERLRYFKAIEGARARHAELPDAMRQADIAMQAKESVLDRELDAAMKALRERTKFERGEESFTKEFNAELIQAYQHALDGKSYDDWKKSSNIRNEGAYQSQGLGSQMHHSWLKGRRERNNASHALKLKLDITAAEREIRNNMPAMRAPDPLIMKTATGAEQAQALKNQWIKDERGRINEWLDDNVRSKFNKYEKGTTEHMLVNEAIAMAAERPEEGAASRERGINKAIRAAEDQRKKAIAIAKRDPAWFKAAERLTKYWQNTDKRKGTLKNVADALGLDAVAMAMPSRLRALRPEHDDLNYDAYVKFRTGWFDKADNINSRLRKVDKDALYTADAPFDTTLTGLDELGKGLLAGEEDYEKELTSATLVAWNDINGEEKRLADIRNPEVRGRVKDYMYRLKGEVTAANYKRAMESAGAFRQLAESQGKSPDIKFFAVREPESKNTMFSYNQKSKMREAAPFLAKIVVKPKYVMTEEDWEKANDEAYEESGWSRDPLTKSLAKPLGEWIYPPHIDPHYKGED